GQTFSNVERLLDTRPPGAELTERGREQATDVALNWLIWLLHGKASKAACAVLSPRLLCVHSRLRCWLRVLLNPPSGCRLLAWTLKCAREFMRFLPGIMR